MVSNKSIHVLLKGLEDEPMDLLGSFLIYWLTEHEEVAPERPLRPAQVDSCHVAQSALQPQLDVFKHGLWLQLR